MRQVILKHPSAVNSARIRGRMDKLKDFLVCTITGHQDVSRNHHSPFPSRSTLTYTLLPLIIQTPR
jgi:hypothetical protein